MHQQENECLCKAYGTHLFPSLLVSCCAVSSFPTHSTIRTNPLPTSAYTQTGKRSHTKTSTLPNISHSQGKSSQTTMGSQPSKPPPGPTPHRSSAIGTIYGVDTTTHLPARTLCEHRRQAWAAVKQRWARLEEWNDRMKGLTEEEKRALAEDRTEASKGGGR